MAHFLISHKVLGFQFDQNFYESSSFKYISKVKWNGEKSLHIHSQTHTHMHTCNTHVHMGGHTQQSTTVSEMSQELKVL